MFLAEITLGTASKPEISLTVSPRYGFETTRRVSVTVDLDQDPKPVKWCFQWLWLGNRYLKPDTDAPRIWEGIISPIGGMTCREINDKSYPTTFLVDLGHNSPLLFGDYKASAMVWREDGSARISTQETFTVLEGLPQ